PPSSPPRRSSDLRLASSRQATQSLERLLHQRDDLAILQQGHHRVVAQRRLPVTGFDRFAHPGIGERTAQSRIPAQLPVALGAAELTTLLRIERRLSQGDEGPSRRELGVVE